MKNQNTVIGILFFFIVIALMIIIKLFFLEDAFDGRYSEVIFIKYTDTHSDITIGFTLKRGEKEINRIYLTRSKFIYDHEFGLFRKKVHVGDSIKFSGNEIVMKSKTEAKTFLYAEDFDNW